LRTVKATTHRAWRSLQDLKKELNERDPDAYKQLRNAEKEAKQCHTRSSAQFLFHHEQITARATRISAKGWLFQPMSDVLLFDLFRELEPTVDDLLN
jgi:hypothetical protein